MSSTATKSRRCPPPAPPEMYRLLRKWNQREPMSQTELGTLMRVSRATIQNIEREAMEKIRRAMGVRA